MFAIARYEYQQAQCLLKILNARLLVSPLLCPATDSNQRLSKTSNKSLLNQHIKSEVERLSKTSNKSLLNQHIQSEFERLSKTSNKSLLN